MKLVLQLFRTKTIHKNKEELESYCVELFKTHCTNMHSVINSSGSDLKDLYGDSAPSSAAYKEHENLSDRFTHDWSVELDSATYLPSGKKQLQLCRNSFSFLYGLKPNTMK